jgi:hypothetical protein
VRLLDGGMSDDEEGEDLCNCEFSLAYGGRILLSGAKLRLKCGGRYGLCGPNGAGKTTLMKAIANGQVDGFPDQREVLTIYVAHDIQAQEEDPLTLDYLARDPLVKQKGLSPEACRKALEEIGFSESQLTLPISAQSGGLRQPFKIYTRDWYVCNEGFSLLFHPQAPSHAHSWCHRSATFLDALPCLCALFEKRNLQRVYSREWLQNTSGSIGLLLPVFAAFAPLYPFTPSWATWKYRW